MEWMIKKVALGTVMPWVSSMHVVPKEDGKLITIDLLDLNKVLLREYHIITTIEDVITRASG